MRRDAFIAAVALATAAPHAVPAEDAGDASLGKRILSPSVPALIPGAEPLLAGAAVDFLTAAITTKTTGTEFRVTSVPLSAVDFMYLPVLSDSSVVLSTDTGTGLSRAGLSLPYNPFSLRSGRAASVIERANQQAACGKKYLADLKACTDPCASLGKSEASEENRKKLRDACSAECRRKADRDLSNCDVRRLASEWALLNDSWAPLIAFTANADFYPYGTAATPQAPATTTNLRWWGGFMLQASATLRKFELLQVDLWGSLRPRWRASGAVDSSMARYVGGGVSASYVLFPFVDRKQLERYPDYAKSGVLPGVALGASAQGNWCTDRDLRCANGRTRQLTATPFVDVRLSSTLQLRVAVPLNWYRSPAKDGTEAAPTFTLAGTVGPPG